jgi:hypothetical protein
MHGTFFAEIYNSSTHVRRARGKVTERHIYTYIYLYEEESEQPQSLERYISHYNIFLSQGVKVKNVFMYSVIKLFFVKIQNPLHVQISLDFLY